RFLYSSPPCLLPIRPLLILSLLMLRPPPTSTLFPYTTLFRSTIRATSAVHQALDLDQAARAGWNTHGQVWGDVARFWWLVRPLRSEEHTSELQSLTNLVCRLLLEKKKKTKQHARRYVRQRTPH